MVDESTREIPWVAPSTGRLDADAQAVAEAAAGFVATPPAQPQTLEHAHPHLLDQPVADLLGDLGEDRRQVVRVFRVEIATRRPIVGH